MTDTSRLSEKAMLAELNISTWAPRKFDKKATSEIHSVNSATSAAGRYSKNLLPPKAMEPIATLVSSARKEHYRLTRPWSDTGPRILPSVLFQEYVQKMKAHANELAPLVAAFVKEFPAHKLAAQDILGTLYNTQDYPDDKTLADKFSINFNILPLPDAQDFRVSLSDEELAEVRLDIEQQTRAALVHGQKAIFGQVATHLEHVVERLAAYTPPKARRDGTETNATSAERAAGIFRDTLITNIRELCETLPALNIEQDQRWDEMTDKLRELSKVEPSTLRKCASTRARTKKSADELLTKVRAYAT